MSWRGQGSLRTPFGETQLLLSGVYVGVCGFRSLFPRVDLERVCLWDTWLSAILLGRIAATIAELSFALQCGLFLQRLSAITDMPLLDVGAQAFVPLVILAELVCWYAVLSLNHIGHAIDAVHRSPGLRSRRGVDNGGRRQDVCPSLADERRGRLPAPRDGTSRQPAPAASDIRVGRLARRAPWMTLSFSIGVWTSLAICAPRIGRLEPMIVVARSLADRT